MIHRWLRSHMVKQLKNSEIDVSKALYGALESHITPLCTAEVPKHMVPGSAYRRRIICATVAKDAWCFHYTFAQVQKCMIAAAKVAVEECLAQVIHSYHTTSSEFHPHVLLQKLDCTFTNWHVAQTSDEVGYSVALHLQFSLASEYVVRPMSIFDELVAV